MQYDEKLVCLFNNIPVDLFHPSNDRCLGSLLLEECMEPTTCFVQSYLQSKGSHRRAETMTLVPGYSSSRGLPSRQTITHTAAASREVSGWTLLTDGK